MSTSDRRPATWRTRGAGLARRSRSWEMQARHRCRWERASVDAKACQLHPLPAAFLRPPSSFPGSDHDRSFMGTPIATYRRRELRDRSSPDDREQLQPVGGRYSSRSGPSETCAESPCRHRASTYGEQSREMRLEPRPDLGKAMASWNARRPAVTRGGSATSTPSSRVPACAE